MPTNIRLSFHAKKMRTPPMTWLVFTLLLSLVYLLVRSFIFFVLGSRAPTYRYDEPVIYIIPSTHSMHVPQAAAAETVKVITTPVFPQIPRHQASKDFQVLVRVEAPPAAVQQQRRRVPVDLAVVLDVGGGAARLDAVKKAVRFVVRQIHDDDRLAIVGPSNYRRVTGLLNTRDARRDAEKSVDDLELRRGEFTSSGAAGLEEAVKVCTCACTHVSASSIHNCAVCMY